jgi:hypothetical protein
VQARRAAFSLLFACSAWQAQAGTVIRQVERVFGNEQPRQAVTMYLDARGIRVEGEEPRSGKYLLIFDGSRQVLWLADLAKNTYLEITKEQVDAATREMRQIEMQVAMAQPAARAVVEQMLLKRLGRMAPPKIITLEEDKLGEFACVRYEVLVNQEVAQEICATEPWNLPVDSEAYETFRTAAEYFELLRRAMPNSGFWTPPRTMRGISGFPIRTIVYEGLLPLSEWVFQTAEDRAIDAGQFTLPPNLRKQGTPQTAR